MLDLIFLCSRLVHRTFHRTPLTLHVPPLVPLLTAKPDARGARQISRARGGVLVRVADVRGNRIGLGS